VLQPSPALPLSAEQREFLEAFGRQAAFAFERIALSERARVSALRAKAEEMRSSLLSTVSHDLRTPLAAITGAATTLRDGGNLVDKTTRGELLESICEEADRLEKLVSNLLDMTRLESGAIGLKRDWIPLEELVGSALTRLENKLEDRTVNIDLPDGLPLLSVDPVLFEQLLINLLENALKYTPVSSPIDILAEQKDGFVTLDIADRGSGLTAGCEERIFEKFYRGVHVGVPGAGLGLPICRGIAEAHGGNIRAENRPGGGSVFRVTLPIMANAPSVPLIDAEVEA
jgi:two-component system sensor histidine kinase KdpD